MESKQWIMIREASVVVQMPEERSLKGIELDVSEKKVRVGS